MNRRAPIVIDVYPVPVDSYQWTDLIYVAIGCALLLFALT